MTTTRSWTRFDHPVDRYARRVLGDTHAGPLIVAGPLVRLACERHLRDRVAQRWTFSVRRADLAFDFFTRILRLPDTLDAMGQPKPFQLEPAQQFILGSLLGWEGADGYRRFREGYIEAGKGSGKTPLLAGLGLYGLVMDGETAPEIYAAAVTRDQARIMFRDVEQMRVCSPELAAQVTKTVNNLAYGLGFFRPYSRDQGQRSGPRPHFALIDEVHEHPTPDVINKLKAGFKFRKQPLAVEITNSGFDRSSICWQHHEHAERMLRGIVEDDRLFAYICALDEGDDPFTDETCWVKANPLLGVTVTPEYLRRQVQNAQHIPAETATVLRLNFCQWTQVNTRAIDLGKWQACSTEIPTCADAPCYGGLDLGQSDDLSAWARVWDLDGTLAVRLRYWIPRAALERYPHRPYAEWLRGGWLTVTEGDTVDYDAIEDQIASDCLQDNIREVAYDPRFAEQLAQHLQGQGIVMIKTLQGFALTESLKRLLERIVAGTLVRGEDPILSWMAGNVVVRHGRLGEIRLDKDHCPEKIDGIAALVMAHDRIIRQSHEASLASRDFADRGLFL